MKGVVPGPASAPVSPDDSIPDAGSWTMVMKPKSARRAVTGLAFVIRILA